MLAARPGQDSSDDHSPSMMDLPGHYIQATCQEHQMLMGIAPRSDRERELAD